MFVFFGVVADAVRGGQGYIDFKGVQKKMFSQDYYHGRHVENLIHLREISLLQTIQTVVTSPVPNTFRYCSAVTCDVSSIYSCPKSYGCFEDVYTLP